MERDLRSSLNNAMGLNIQIISSDTTTVGNIIDTVGNESLTYVLMTGTVTDGDYAVTIEHGDDSGLSDGAPVASTDLIGSLPAFTDDGDDDLTLDVGYVGKKRFVRCSVVSTNTSSGATLGVLATKGNASSQPQPST